MAEEGSPILGLHLEGHYLSPKKAGAQLPDAIKNPDPAEYKPLIEDFPCIKRWDIAPELDGALELGEYLTSKGVLPSIAHTSAVYDDVVKGYEVGYRHVTHFYNAMGGFHNVREYKQEGTVESVYLIDGMTVEVIADGIHVPIPLLKLVYKIKGVEGTALCTDGLSCSAGDENMYLDPRFIIENGVCKLADRSALAGSVATMDRLIRTMVNEAGVTLFDAVRMSSETPARIMGVFDRKGSIKAGKDADMCIYDADLNLKGVIAYGKKVV
jgi:N-acetylglucosamine-6-phosphate deacetylase